MAKAFGEQNPTQGEDAVSWATWSDGAAGSPTVSGDANWGKLSLDLSGEEGRSVVYDLGSAIARKFTLTENRYGTGLGDADLQIRGSASAFSQDDALPAWDAYSTPVIQSWRYVQVRAITDPYLINQNFEGTGFDNGETWYYGIGTGGTGIANPDYTTGPLRGSQSLRMKDDSETGCWCVTKFANDTGLYDLYGFFLFKLLDYPNAMDEFFTIWYGQGDLETPDFSEFHEVIRVDASGNLALHHGQSGTQVAISASPVISLNTLYYVWWYASRAADNTISGWIKVGTTPSLPGSNAVVWTNYDITGQSTVRGSNVAGFTNFHGGVYEYLADQTIISDTAIGSPPA